MHFQINKRVDQCNWSKQTILNKSGVVKRSDQKTPSEQTNKRRGGGDLVVKSRNFRKIEI
jgi:hypothetical protein